MTAGIGVFNKMAAVIAADSAGTIGNGRKVFNTANKIFKLADDEKVGVFVYNYSSWFGVPIELIVKLYKNRTNRKFAKLEEYVADFKDFLLKDILVHTDQESLNNYVISIFYQLVDEFLEVINSELSNSPASDEAAITNHLIGQIEEYIEDTYSNSADEKVVDVTLAKFRTHHKKEITSLIRGFCSSQNLIYSKQLEEKIIELVYLSCVLPFSQDEFFIGIVFAGYGVDEIYPSTFEIRFSGFVCDQFKYFVYGSSSIDNSNSAFIAPFAQAEMAETFMEGVNPVINIGIENLLVDALHELQIDLEKKMAKRFKSLDEEFGKAYSSIIVGINKLKHEMMVMPVISTLSLMRKEDLIEIAESLVELTSLKRKASLDVETVGGPIDVAIITKSEGFVWVKRKETLSKF